MDKLKTLLKQKNINYETIAKVCGISKPAVSKKMNTRSPWLYDEVVSICAFLEISAEEYFLNKD